MADRTLSMPSIGNPSIGNDQSAIQSPISNVNLQSPINNPVNLQSPFGNRQSADRLKIADCRLKIYGLKITDCRFGLAIDDSIGD